MEANEKTTDSRLAREFVVALPIELGKGQWRLLLTEDIQSNFVTEGMCADVAIHDTDDHNPHAHIMLTVRPLDERKEVPVWNLAKRQDLAKQIAVLAEDIEELRSEKAERAGKQVLCETGICIAAAPGTGGTGYRI